MAGEHGAEARGQRARRMRHALLHVALRGYTGDRAAGACAYQVGVCLPDVRVAGEEEGEWRGLGLEDMPTVRILVIAGHLRALRVLTAVRSSSTEGGEEARRLENAVREVFLGQYVRHRQMGRPQSVVGRVLTAGCVESVRWMMESRLPALSSVSLVQNSYVSLLGIAVEECGELVHDEESALAVREWVVDAVERSRERAHNVHVGNAEAGAEAQWQALWAQMAAECACGLVMRVGAAEWCETKLVEDRALRWVQFFVENGFLIWGLPAPSSGTPLSLWQRGVLLRLARHYSWTELLHSAAMGGVPSILDYLLQTVSTPQRTIDCIANTAARAGRLAALELLHDRYRAQCTMEAMSGAVQDGAPVCIVKYLYHTYASTCRKAFPTPTILDTAARRGSLRVLEFLFSHFRAADIPITTNSMDWAAAHGQLRTLEWLHTTRPDAHCTTDSMDKAATMGHFHVIEWLHHHTHAGCTTTAMDGAVSNSHMEIAKFLLTVRGQQPSASLACSLVRGGNKDALLWMLETVPSQVDMRNAVATAINSGRHQLLQFLDENHPESFANALRALAVPAPAKERLHLGDRFQPRYIINVPPLRRKGKAAGFHIAKRFANDRLAEIMADAPPTTAVTL